jgi:Glyoxalase-like domain
VRIDDVIWTTKDLDGAAARLEREHGLEVVGGGRHTGHGTHNRIAPLGRGFLEILAVADADEAAASPVGRAVAVAPEGLFGWAVAVADAGVEAQRLSAGLARIERGGMSASLAAVQEAMAEPWLPFFTQRDAGIPDPGVGRDAGGIAWIELAGDAQRLRAWLGGAALPVRVVQEEPPGLRSVGLGSGTVIR